MKQVPGTAVCLISELEKVPTKASVIYFLLPWQLVTE
jgi:hypothetical protein